MGGGSVGEKRKGRASRSLLASAVIQTWCRAVFTSRAPIPALRQPRAARHFLKPRSVLLVDVAIDRAAACRDLAPDDPLPTLSTRSTGSPVLRDGCCRANIPFAGLITSTTALTNATLPYCGGACPTDGARRGA